MFRLEHLYLTKAISFRGKKCTEKETALDCRYPQFTKEQIVKSLTDENLPIEGKEKYSQLIVVLEIKKLNEGLGIYKGELYREGKLELRGSFLVPLKLNQDETWDELEAGESAFYGVTLDSREKKLSENIINFFKRSFKDASIQDFIPGKGKNK
ncbi:MAG: hypothetical protein HY555_04705 [Euryarchaeota archaeon]|nr:hypothetical protein [Euryarchaeota archaeon]